MSRQEVSALFKVEKTMAPLTMAFRMRKRTKRDPRSHRQPPPLSLPAPQWWHGRNPPHRHPIQKRKNRTSSRPFWVGRRRQTRSIMETRPVALSARPLLVVCSHHHGQFLHELRVVAPSRAVARGSSAPPACPPHTTSVHTMMCLVSS